MKIPSQLLNPGATQMRLSCIEWQSLFRIIVCTYEFDIIIIIIIIIKHISQLLAGFWKNDWLVGWRVVSVTVLSVRACLSAASGWLTVGLVDRSAERQEYGMERVDIKMRRGARIESPQAPRILYPAKSWATRGRAHELYYCSVSKH